MSSKFIIEGILPGLNEMVNLARGNKFKSAEQKKLETERCAFEAKRFLLGSADGPIRLVITWVEPNNRRDIDNVSAGTKYILDGLVQAGILPSDGRKWVKGLEHRFPEKDPKRPRIEVEIFECAS